MKFSQYIWALYLIIFPFYMLPEGNPQVADIFGALLILSNLRPILLSIKTNQLTRYLFLFVIYSFIVNAIWMIILKDILTLKYSLYYFYSFLFMLYIFSRLKDKAFVNFTYKAVSISLTLQIVLWPFIQSQGVRTQMFFRNPNQLALWAICLLIIIYVLARLLNKKSLQMLPMLLICTFFIIISASRAALVGSLFFWMFYIIKSRKHFFVFSTITILGIVFIGHNYEIDYKNIEAFEYNMDRFSNNTISGNQGVGTRGFHRITENPQYLLFGAGEGENERFGETIELHSTFASVFFCYGLIGILLYLAAFKSILKNPSLEIFALFIAISFFASVHMTLRIPFFWISLLLIIYLHSNNNLTNKELSTD